MDSLFTAGYRLVATTENLTRSVKSSSYYAPQKIEVTESFVYATYHKNDYGIACGQWALLRSGRFGLDAADECDFFVTTRCADSS